MGWGHGGVRGCRCAVHHGCMHAVHAQRLILSMQPVHGKSTTCWVCSSSDRALRRHNVCTKINITSATHAWGVTLFLAGLVRSEHGPLRYYAYA